MEYVNVSVEIIGDARHGGLSGLKGLSSVVGTGRTASFAWRSDEFCEFVGRAAGSLRDNWTGLGVSCGSECDEFFE